MIDKDILGTWVCYKISSGEREQRKDETNTSQWTFKEDGSLTYRFMVNNEFREDRIDRNWKIHYNMDGPVILINDEETYKIISLENGVLILESIKGEGMRHYYANANIYQAGTDMEKLP